MIELLQNLGIFSVTIGVLAALIRSLGLHYLDKKIELHKANLDKNAREFQHSLDSDLENFRNQLKFEFVKYARIHEERLKIVRELYQLLIDLHREMKELTLFLWPKTEEKIEDRRIRVIDQAVEALNNFKRYYLYEKIMFNEDTCTLIDEVLKEFEESLRLNTFEERWGPGEKAIKDFKKESTDIVDNKIPLILNKLETEFRTQIGSLN